MHRPEYVRISPLPDEFHFAYLKDLPGGYGIIAVHDDEGYDKGGHFLVIDTQLRRGVYLGYDPTQERDTWGTYPLTDFCYTYGDGGGQTTVLGLALIEEGGNTDGGYRHGFVYGHRIGTGFGKTGDAK